MAKKIWQDEEAGLGILVQAVGTTLAGIEYILGLKIRNGTLSLEPCIPAGWKEYLIRYKYGKSIYNIKVYNPSGRSTGIERFVVNGNEIKEKSIKLDGNGGIFEIELVM